MRALLSLALLLAAPAYADDETAIRRAIVALNQIPPPGSLFTADSDAPHVLDRLRIHLRHLNRPTVVISHDPWGEANIVFPPVVLANPAIAPGAVRLITPDVAIVDAACIYTVETIPLLFVMRKEGNDWKIASARILARWLD
jgi:hypothetical protein